MQVSCPAPGLPLTWGHQSGSGQCHPCYGPFRVARVFPKMAKRGDWRGSGVTSQSHAGLPGMPPSHSGSGQRAGEGLALTHGDLPSPWAPGAPAESQPAPGVVQPENLRPSCWGKCQQETSRLLWFTFQEWCTQLRGMVARRRPGWTCQRNQQTFYLPSKPPGVYPGDAVSGAGSSPSLLERLGPRSS